MNLLAFDTATEACGVALLREDALFEVTEVVSNAHTDWILPMVDNILKQAKIDLKAIDAIAYGAGPGSFTGLRVAASVVQGLSFAIDCPVIPVSTLQALAEGAWRLYQVPQVVAAIDARMQQIYWGLYRYQEGMMLPQTPEQLTRPEFLQLPEGQWAGVGSGFLTYPKQNFPTHPLWYPSARDVLTIAKRKYEKKEYIAPEEALPVYIRDQVVQA